MTIKAYDGTSWYNQKSLKIYNGSAWSTAKQAWIFDGSNWRINYPEFPVNTAGPSITALSGIAGRIGCVYIASVGSWNSNDAYNPTSYSYQWTRAGSIVSGATNNTYATGADDVEKIIGCQVTATNLRGSTPASATTGLTMLTQITSINVSDNTATPNIPSAVSIGNTGLSYSGSFTTLDNLSTSYEAVGGGTAGTPSVNSSAKTFSGTGTAGNASVSIRGVNTNRQIYVSWTSAIGASSYDIYINGNLHTNITPGSANSYIFNAPDETARNFSVYPRSTNTQGYGVGYATAVAATTKYSGYRTSAEVTLSNPVPVNTSAPTLTPTGGYTVGQTLTYGVGSWSNSPTSYDLRLYRGTPNVATNETLVASSTNSSATHTIQSSEYSDGRYYYRAFATATNSGGTSNGGTFTPGAEGGPLAEPVVTPSGGSASLSGGVSTGSTLSASTSGWAGSPTSYFIKITRGTANVQSYETTVASSNSSSTSYTVQSGDAGYYFKAFATASNSAGTSGEAASGELGPATNPVVATRPTITATNSWSNPGVNTWTLSMTHTGGGVPTTFNWGIQFSNSDGGTVLSSTTGSGNWTAGSGGTQTVTRNSSSYSYARWVSVTASNASGTSTSQATTWE